MSLATLDTVTTGHTLDVSATTPGFGDLLAVLANAGATDLYDASYTYDDRGRIDTWTETVLGSTKARKLHYDGAGRLVEVEDLQSGATLEEYAQMRRAVLLSPPNRLALMGVLRRQMEASCTVLKAGLSRTGARRGCAPWVCCVCS